MAMAVAARQRRQRGEGHGNGGGGVVAMAIEQGGRGAQRQLIYAVVGTISVEEKRPLERKTLEYLTKTIISGSELLTPIPSY